MKNLLFAVLTILLIASCTESKEARELFAHVESVMNEYPDSAFAMLDSASVQKDSWNTREQMRYELLRAKAQNKAYIDFTTDSVMKEVAEYYDAHGTPNEQMEAHYLLGCTYRDLHESPMALSCYLDATEKADTLSDDCDYSTLMRIWGQVADEYDRQIMPYNELEANEHYRKCALKCEDIPNYIAGIELKRRPYFILRDTTSVINSFEKAFQLYKSYGLVEDAAKSIPPVLPIYINRNEIEKSKELISYFEQYSNLFDKDLNIRRGHEFYYYIKGEYYEHINQLDKAELCYRKLLQGGYEYDAYVGLLSIYLSLNETDSILKYSLLKDQSFDENITANHTQAMFNAEGMYNYTRNQRIAEEKNVEAKLLTSRIIIIVLSTIFMLIVCATLFIIYKNKKKAEIYQLINQYEDSQLNWKNAVSDYELMCKDFNAFKLMKDAEICELQKKCEELSLNFDKSCEKILLDKLRNNEQVKKIIERVRIAPGHFTAISSDEWACMFELARINRPHFYYSVICNQQITDQEKKISMLSILGKSTKEISVLLNTSLSNVSNAKKSISLKIFTDNTAKNFNCKILEL